jgi:hypothetical protein
MKSGTRVHNLPVKGQACQEFRATDEIYELSSLRYARVRQNREIKKQPGKVSLLSKEPLNSNPVRDSDFFFYRWRPCNGSTEYMKDTFVTYCKSKLSGSLDGSMEKMIKQDAKLSVSFKPISYMHSSSPPFVLHSLPITSSLT